MKPFESKPCVWNEITYLSQQEAAEALCLTPSGMCFRLQSGYTCDVDIEARGSLGVACAWNGIPYKSIAAAARANDVSKPTMWYRLRRGYTCDADMRAHKNRVGG